MRNTYLYNVKKFNEIQPTDIDMLVDGDIFYNDFKLALVDDITINGFDNYNGPLRNLDTAKVPRDDGLEVLADFHDRKIVVINGILRTPDSIILNERIDEIKKELSKQDGILQTQFDSQLRLYQGNFVNLDSAFPVRQHFNVNFIPFTFQFQVTPSFGESKFFVSRSLLDETDLDLDEELSNLGTTKANLITIAIFSETSGVTKINLTNVTTSEEIEITKVFSPGDVLEINGDTKEVLVNGVDTDYDGFFPKLETGDNSIEFAVTGTSAKYDVTFKFKKKYL